MKNAVLGADMPWAERRAYAQEYPLDIIGKIWPYVLIGIGAGAWINGYVPQGLLARWAGPGSEHGKIQVLGGGRPKCAKPHECAETAAKELGIAYEMGKTSDYGKIAEAGFDLKPGGLPPGRRLILDKMAFVW